jgi:PAS domain S-box-containing protein
MNGREPSVKVVARWRWHAWLLGVGWTGCVAASLLWNLTEQEDRSLAMAVNGARITLENDVLYRHWAAAQGGVYVRVSPQVPPNPYLTVPDRDVTTTSGLSLTLVNPAYMVRLVHSDPAATGGSHAHITSLKLLRPENAPDAWEAAALRSFEQGVQEVSSVEPLADGEYLRLMRPFRAEKACLNCHAAQGCREGDVRGGLCVSVPLAPLRAIESHVNRNLTLAHAGLWLFGLVGIAVSSRVLGRQLQARQRAEQALRTSDERRRVAEAVQAERQRLHDVLEILPAYVVLLTPDCHVPFANRFFEERFGKSHGKRCFEYLFQRTEPCEHCETYKVLQTHAPHHWEWTGPDGRSYDVHDFPFTDADGSPLIMEMGIDITEIKRAQAALEEVNKTLEQRVAERTAELRESEARYRSYMEVALQVGWTTNGDGEVVGDLPAWRRFTGQTLEEIQGWGWARALHPDDVARTSAVWRQAVASKQRYETEYRLRRQDGVYRHLLARGVPACDDDGSVREWVGTCIDITEHKQAEERIRLLSTVTAELLASDQPQRAVETICRRVMDQLDCQVFFNFLVDEQKRRLQLNACAGVSEDTARRIEWLEYGSAVCGCMARDGCRIVAEHIQTTSDPRADLVRSLGVQAYACHPLVNQGQTIGTLSFGSRLRPTFSEDELELMKAVTDHVAVAMQRLRLLKSLESQTKAAEAANEAKSRFLANMSHELRTPMNAILGMIDVALPKATDPTVQDCLQTARGSADLLLTLLNSLLDSAKIESGKLELESAPFSLRRMLDQLTRVLAVRASEKGLSFCCRLPEGAPDAVLGDRMRLQQVLLNLAGNAIKFTERGSVEISLHVLSQDREADLEFAVRDTGIGIAPSSQERLFQPFAQADASMTRRFGGTGLGLAICQGLVEMMGGRIWVESELGQGSTFHFTVRLPLAQEPPADADAPVVIPTAASKLRILLVEDNPANQKLATYLLQDRGHRVEIAGDGREAVSLAQQNRYDVILMDVQMPGMDGLEATVAIRAAEKGTGSIGVQHPPGRSGESDLSPPPPRVPIIAVTAHAMHGNREQCLAAGMDGFLSKPINGNEMIALVESLAARTPSAAAASTAPEGAKPSARTVFDTQLALQRCANKPRLFAEMAQCFLADVDRLLPQMRAALQGGDLQAVGRLGHRLKGTVVYLGAEPAREAALRVERFCKSSDGTPSEAKAAIDALERECIALRSALQQYSLAAEPTPSPEAPVGRPAGC